MVANDSGYCPRHQMLMPALAAEIQRKRDAAERKKILDAKDKRRLGGRR